MINLIITIILAVMAACIAVLEWLTNSRNRGITWGWITAFWLLISIKEILTIFNI